MDGTPNNFAGIILAAGFGTRLGRPKATVEYRGKTLLEHGVRLMLQQGCQQVITVVGPWHKYWRLERAGELVVNHNPESGQGVSVVLGVRAVRQKKVIILPVDSAMVRPDTVKQVLNAYNSGHGDIVKPTFMGKGGHPMVLSRELVLNNQALIRNKGLRALQFLKGVTVHRVKTLDPLCVKDMDTFEDFLDLCVLPEE